MRVLDDPMMAWFVPLTVLLVVAWSMYYQLSSDPRAHVWWGQLLTRARLLPQEDPTGLVEVDHREVLTSSRNFFKWLGIVAIGLVLLQAFLVYRRYNPYFLWGPKPVNSTTPGVPATLPRRQPGAGGSGPINVVPSGAPQMRGTETDPGSTSGAPTPGMSGTGMPAGPAAGAPGPGGPPSAPAPVGGAPALPGGGAPGGAGGFTPSFGR